jgi:hypothetical protein
MNRIRRPPALGAAADGPRRRVERPRLAALPAIGQGTGGGRQGGRHDDLR